MVVIVVVPTRPLILVIFTAAAVMVRRWVMTIIITVMTPLVVHVVVMSAVNQVTRLFILDFPFESCALEKNERNIN